MVIVQLQKPLAVAAPLAPKSNHKNFLKTKNRHKGGGRNVDLTKRNKLMASFRFPMTVCSWLILLGIGEQQDLR